MKYKVKIDPQAQQDMMEILQYVAVKDSVDAANTLLNEIEETVIKLDKYPSGGHISEELRTTGIKKSREVRYKPYRIIYEIKQEIIYVHCVLDGRRNIQEILGERILRRHGNYSLSNLLRK